MNTPTLGAVIATLDSRPTLLRTALDSLIAKNAQSSIDLVVVSQGSPAQIEVTKEVIKSLNRPITHVITTPGLSAARNAGVQQLNTTFVCFPDDDCRYETDRVEKLLGILATLKRGESLCLPVFSEADSRPLGHPPAKATTLNRTNCHRAVLSAGLVTPTDVFRTVGGFNDMLGLGAKSPWTAGEETDYALRLLQEGYPLQFQPLRLVIHPDDPQRSLNSEIGYGLGFGYACGRNNVPFHVSFGVVGRPVLRAAVQLISGKPLDARQSFVRSLSRLVGIASGQLSRRSSDIEPTQPATYYNSSKPVLVACPTGD